MKRKSLLLLLVFYSAISCGEKVDLLVYNANIYTANKNFDKATAFVVNNGRFTAVGGDELVSKYNPTNTVDAQGLSILPGLIDSNSHLLELGLNEFKVDLRNANGIDDVIQKIKKHQFKLDQKFIQGKGWDQNQWKSNVFPNNQKLNAAFPDTPVVLERIDGHAYLVNQKAIDMADINYDSEVEGGQIGKRKGEISGLFVNNAKKFVEKIIPKYSKEDKIKALIYAQNLCFENGFTTVDQSGISKKDIYLIDSLQKKGLMKLRVYAMIENEPEAIDHFTRKGIYKTDLLNVRSVKVVADGALRSRGAALKMDYSDHKGHKGSLLISKDSLLSIARLLAAKSFQMNTHAIGDAANQVVLEVYNEILDQVKDPRWRIEYAQVIADEDFQKFNPKIIPSIQPIKAISDMPWAMDRLGAERIQGAFAYKDLLDWSGILALGTDFPVKDINPFKNFYAAIARKTTDGVKSKKEVQSRNALTRYETLLGMTRWAAHANFEEKEKGSIEVGKFADFVILDQDIMKVGIDTVLKTQIVATILNGKIVFSNRL